MELAQVDFWDYISGSQQTDSQQTSSDFLISILSLASVVSRIKATEASFSSYEFLWEKQPLILLSQLCLGKDIYPVLKSTWKG